MESDHTLPVYRLADGVRLHRSGDEIRFRKGVWSHQEATLRLTSQPAPVVAFLNAVHDAFARGDEADVAGIGRSQNASAEEMSQYQSLLDSLEQQQFLRKVTQKDAARMTAGLLGGSVLGFDDRIASPRPALFFADSEFARTSAAALAREMRMPLDFADAELLHELATADLTSRTDAVDHTETAARFDRVIQPYTSVLGCLASPNLSLLRNVNRLLIRAGKPLILGLIDGPFLTTLSTLPTETGCFECFEQRMLARLEDLVVYQQFVDATRALGGERGAWAAPHLQALVSAVISESYLFSTIGMMRLTGRVVNVYLPLLEIQVQDLLRVPYCPACGYVARAQMNEMYTSTRRLVNEMLGRITVEG